MIAGVLRNSNIKANPVQGISLFYCGIKEIMPEKEKHPGGRPLKFQSVEELQVKIDKYFEETPGEEWTVTGLALALDTYRDVLNRYEKKEEFYNPIKRAKEKVHNAYEKDLRKKGRSGDIFALKNFGWTDKTELDLGAKESFTSLLAGMISKSKEV